MSDIDHKVGKIESISEVNSLLMSHLVEFTEYRPLENDIRNFSASSRMNQPS